MPVYVPMKKIFASLSIGLSFALAFALPHFTDPAYNRLDKFSLVFVPAFALASIVYFLYPYAEKKWGQASFPLRALILYFAFQTAIFFIISLPVQTGLQLIVTGISSTAVFTGMALPAASSFQKMIGEKNIPRLFSGWFLGSIAAFFVTGFLSNFYSELYQIVLLALLSQLALGIFSYYVTGRARHLAQKNLLDFGVTLSLFILPVIFLVMIFRMNSQFPDLFDAGIFLLEKNQVNTFFIISSLSFFWLAWAIQYLKELVLYNFLAQNKAVKFIRENLSGLLLSALFFCLYLLIAAVLNLPKFDVDDIFFDSDGFIWRFRLTTDNWQDFYWRSVHPLALLTLKSLVNFLSIFLNGNLHFAVIVLTAAAGAACVFLAWMFIRSILKSALPALIMASLLGLSTSHLFFGSLVETYIFLAAITLFFFVLMQKENSSLPLLISVGVVTMGITLTNFAQTVIALFCARPNFRFIFKYIFIVVALVVSLALVSNVFYPNASPYFFVPSSFLAERQNVRAVSLNRAQALTRAFLFNNIAAPSPMMSHKDIPFTQFRFYRAEDFTISEYSTPLQSVTVWVWLVFLIIAAIFFIKDLKSHPMSLTLSLIGCVLFNLLIHLRYGKELFLYSPNWTYAVVLLLGISWKKLLMYKWFQISLIAFLFLLALNNMDLFRTIMNASSSYIK